MIYAIDTNDSRVIATPKQKAICPICRQELIAKCGSIKVWHFAHINNTECDSFAEHESQWHIDWKNRFDKSMQEVIIEKDGVKHIADILVNRKVVELQHSPISDEDIFQRERFYGSMVWVFDLIPKIKKGHFYKSPACHLRNNKQWSVIEQSFTISGVNFSFDWGSRIYGKIDRELFFDIGNELLEVKSISSDGTISGYGYLRSYEYFMDKVRGVIKKVPEIKIEIIDVRLVDNGFIKASIDFMLGDSIFYEWLVFDYGDGAGLNVSSPCNTWIDHLEVKRYKPLIKFQEPLAMEVSRCLLKAYKQKRQYMLITGA